MYGNLGETELERQTRLREAAQTDTILSQLFPEPKPQMLPELTTTVKGGWLFPLIAGIVAAWYLGGGSKRRTLW